MHSTWNSVYVSVRSSVRPSVPSTCGWFAAECPAGAVYQLLIDISAAGARTQQQMRAASRWSRRMRLIADLSIGFYKFHLFTHLIIIIIIIII